MMKNAAHIVIMHHPCYAFELKRFLKSRKKKLKIIRNQI